MPTQVSNVLDEAKDLIKQRISELDDERKRLERALSDLTGGKRSPGRPRSQSNGSSGTKRRRRRGGTRAEHALRHIKENPGMTASEIASKLGIKPNYVYRVMAGLEEDGKVAKQGKGYHAA